MTKPKVILKCPKCMWHKNISSYSGDTYGGFEKCEKCGERILISAKNWIVIRE
jgi:DNA-directed RNA polymerase subunit RPC12/RpoP